MQNISPCPVRISPDIPFSSLVSFSFCLLVFSFLKWKIFIVIHIRLSGRASKFFTKPISGNKTTFLVLGYILLFEAGNKEENLVYLIEWCFYFNYIHLYKFLFCFKLATKNPWKGDTPLFVDTKGEPWGSAYVMNNIYGF